MRIIHEITVFTPKKLFPPNGYTPFSKTPWITFWNSQRTQIIQANNRRHYICVKCDNMFWSIFDLGLYNMFHIIIIITRFRRQCGIIEIPCNLQNWPFVYDTCPKFRNPEHVLAVGNEHSGDQFLQ